MQALDKTAPSRLLWVWGRLQTPVLLVLIGLFSAVTSYVISYSSNLSELLKWNLSRSEGGYLIWIIYATWCVLLAVLSLYVTLTFCPQASGGGMVDMKVLLSGHSPEGTSSSSTSSLLAKQLIPVKILGLMLALASGLSVGKEGPLVQVTAAFATLLMNSFGDIFDRVRDSESKRLDVLACACAAGISSTFGAAYGGVMYSIEVLCINSSSNNIPRAYLCGICSMLVFFWLGADSHVSLYMRAKKEHILTNQENAHDENKIFRGDEILICMLLGVLCGVTGSLFCMGLQFVCAVRGYMFRASLPLNTRVWRQYAAVCSVALLISPLMYMEEGFGVHSLNPYPEPLLDVVFRYRPIEITPRVFFYFPFKFVVTILCVALPLPVGLFDPVFLLGGVFGRIVGTVLSHYPAIAPAVSPREFALIGAAAFSTGVTRAVSTTVIVYELSGQKHMHLPLSVAVVMAYFVGNRFSKSAYDVILDSGRFKEQLVPKIPVHLHDTPIKDVIIESNLRRNYCNNISINRNNSCKNNNIETGNGNGHNELEGLYLRGSVRDLLDLVERIDRSSKLPPGAAVACASTEVPVLESELSRLVVGCVQVSELRAAAVSYTCGLHAVDLSSQEVVFVKPNNNSRKLERLTPRLILNKQEESLSTHIFDADNQPPPPYNSKGWQWEVYDVKLVAHRYITHMVIEINPSPHQVDEDFPLKKVADLMRNLKLDQILVTSAAQYVGSVSRNELYQFVQQNSDSSSDYFFLANCLAFREMIEYFGAFLATEKNKMYAPI